MNEKSNFNTLNTINPTIPDECNSQLNYCLEDKFKFQNFEELSLNAINSIYSREDSYFKKNIDKLNQKFYAESNKFLTLKAEMEKSHDNLFSLLFKQISNYNEEIDKLNYKLKEKEESLKLYKTRYDEV